MADSAQMSKNSFLYSQSRYYGLSTPEHLAFNANLQEFAQRVSYISALETAGKLSPEEAYIKIKDLWKQLKQSKKTLEISDNNLPQLTS
jgi:polyhydroxyalkanoate synthesis regulator phasin